MLTWKPGLPHEGLCVPGAPLWAVVQRAVTEGLDPTLTPRTSRPRAAGPRGSEVLRTGIWKPVSFAQDTERKHMCREPLTGSSV